MKKYLLLLFLTGAFICQLSAYPKKSLVERYTNCYCAPCASLNSSFYTETTRELVSANTIAHIVYNVNWPGATDPMYVLNASDNAQRWAYYGVNGVPWIDVNGTNIDGDQTALTSSVNSGNAEVSPFKIVLTPEIFSDTMINVHVKILRDPADVASFSNTKLRVGLTEKTISYSTAPGSNGEKVFYSITRKMLPDAAGTLLNIPAPGDSLEMDIMYIPTPAFLAAVNIDSLRVVAFIQSDNTKEIYQSEMQDIQKGNHLIAAFRVDETVGSIPYQFNFHDFSSSSDSSQIVSWKWDFNNDGNVESTDQNPIYSFPDAGTYTIKLTVKDSKQNEYTRVMPDYITVVGSTSDILVVNGIDYSTYGSDMANFYNSSVCFGGHNVDVWDLFGNQGFNFAANAKIKQVDLISKTIPLSVLKLYKKVIWIGNNYNGDINNYNPAAVLSYVRQGGYFLLATRMGASYFDASLKSYMGISVTSADLTINKLYSLDNHLVDMPAITTNSNTLVDMVKFNSLSKAIPLFTNDTTSVWKSGFRIHYDNEGVFIYIAGRPYKYDPTASTSNYNYIIDNYMAEWPTGINENNMSSTVTSYNLDQNYPNPFNPSTTIKYALPSDGFANLTIYNTLGQKVATLVNQYMQAGNHQVNFNASGLSSGIYFYRLEAGNFTSIKKMILLK